MLHCMLFNRNTSPTWVHTSVELRLDYRQAVAVGTASFAKIEKLTDPNQRLDAARMAEPGEKVRHKSCEALPWFRPRFHSNVCF